MRVAIYWIYCEWTLHVFCLCVLIQVKSMTQHVSHLDKHSVPRRSRFSDRFKDDISTIVSVVTAEIGTILVKQHKVSNAGGEVSVALCLLSVSQTCAACLLSMFILFT